MARRQALLLLSVVGNILFVHDAHAFEWKGNLENGTLVYACEGYDVEFPWDFHSGARETIVNTEYLYSGGGSEELIATYIHKQFLPTATFSGNVERQGTTNMGITLKNVTTASDGHYTVAVSFVDTATSGYHTVRKTAVLHVATAKTAAADVTLHITRHQEAVYDNQTGRYHIQLSCSSQGQPPDNVTFTTPSGDHYPGSLTADGNFTFLIPHPIEEGNYTCRVPFNASVAKCVAPSDPSLNGTQIAIDKIESRLTLLEAETEALRNENNALKDANNDLKASNDNLTNFVHGMEEALRQVNPNLTTVIEKYYQSLSQSDETIKQRITELQVNLISENTQLKTKNDDLADYVHSMETTLNATKDRVDRNTAALAQVSANSTDFEAIVKGLRHNLTEESAALGQSHLHLADRVDTLERELKADDSRQRDEQANLTEVVHQLESQLMSESVEFREEALNLTGVVHDVKDDLLHEEASLKDYAHRLEENITAENLHLKKENADLTAHVQRLESSMKSEHTALREDTSRLNASVANLDATLQQYTSNWTDHTHDLETALAAEDDRIRQKQANLTVLMNTLENKVSQSDAELTQNMQNFHQNITTELSKVKEGQANMTGFVRDVENLREKVENMEKGAEDRIAKLEGEYSHLAENGTVLRQRLSDAETAVLATEDRLRNDTSSLSQQLNDLQSAFQQQQADLLQARHTLEMNLTEQAALFAESGANLTQHVHNVEAKLEAETRRRTQDNKDLTEQFRDLATSLSQYSANQTEELRSLEADLTAKHTQLEEKTSQLTDNVRDLEHNSTLERGHLKDELANVTVLVRILEADVRNISSQQQGGGSDLLQYVHSLAERLNGTSSTGVAFHASLGDYLHLQNGETVIPDKVITNEGKGYNSTTGVFTAPYDGTYFFIATTSPYQPDKYTNMNLVVEDTDVSKISVKYGEYYDMGTCHAVVHLRKGHQVWLRSFGEGYYIPAITAFSGFLVHADTSV